MEKLVTPLTPEQRRQLIEQPLAIRTLGGAARWSGTGVASDDGLHRHYTPRHATLDDDTNGNRGDHDGE